MLKKWIKYLCDPVDKSPLRFYQITEKNGQDVISGILKSRTGNTYQIKDGVPILLSSRTQTIESVESFAYEWEQFDYEYGKNSWLRDVIKPTVGSVKYFKNKIVMDCGAGSGRQSLWVAEAGAKLVFSIELSDSVRTMVRKVTKNYKGKIFIIQADIANIPIKKESANIDIAYCVNVIQHTKNPIKTAKEISKLLNKGADFIFNIYLERGNRFLISIVQMIKDTLNDSPKWLIKAISFIFAVILYLFRPNGIGFKEFWLDIYDLLGSHHYQKFYSEQYLQTLLNRIKCNISKRAYYAMLLKKQ